MRDDIPAAACRLLATQTVRTHERTEPRHRTGPQHRGYTVRAADKRGPAGISRPVQIGRRTFESITKAKEAMHISPATLYAMLDSGEAHYV